MFTECCAGRQRPCLLLLSIFLVSLDIFPFCKLEHPLLKALEACCMGTVDSLCSFNRFHSAVKNKGPSKKTEQCQQTWSCDYLTEFTLQLKFGTAHEFHATACTCDTPRRTLSLSLEKSVYLLKITQLSSGVFLTRTLYTYDRDGIAWSQMYTTIAITTRFPVLNEIY